MNRKIASSVIALLMLAGIAEVAQATEKTHQKTRILTGCLQKGDDANEFNFTAKDGGTWEIKSDNVKLADHVGHTVKITGVVSNPKIHGMKEDAKAAAKEHGIGKNSTEHGEMTVTNLKMVSDSCQK